MSKQLGGSNSQCVASNTKKIDGGLLLNIKQVCALVSLSRATIYRLIEHGDPLFPTPVKIGSSSRWLLTDIIEWVGQVSSRGGR